MRKSKLFPSLASCLLATGMLVLGACVTINVYFPAAEAQQAAAEFVDKVIGNDPANSAPPPPASRTPRWKPTPRASATAPTACFPRRLPATSGTVPTCRPA